MHRDTRRPPATVATQRTLHRDDRNRNRRLHARRGALGARRVPFDVSHRPSRNCRRHNGSAMVTLTGCRTDLVSFSGTPYRASDAADRPWNRMTEEVLRRNGGAQHA